MASPFPGMDPYLESCWGDVHASFIIYSREQIQAQLPPGLRARVEERVFVDMGNGYDDDLDYRQEPEPPLSAEDVAWADDLLRKAGRR